MTPDDPSVMRCWRCRFPARPVTNSDADCALHIAAAQASALERIAAALDAIALDRMSAPLKAEQERRREAL